MAYRIYTKTGDKGETSLIGGTRMSKASARLEAYGTADELNSFIGLLRAKLNDEEIDAVLNRIQNKLFNLGGFLATDTNVTQTCDATEIAQEEIDILERLIDKWQEELPPVRGFILPGGSEAIALCHVCRTVTRRLERRMVALFGDELDDSPKAQNCLQYVNRLSDFLFILSKKIAKSEEKALFLWEK
ncbi:MAG: cob(I)yrinic acid a,c-diamide adenosyltransferase [Paludibacteraceae bacterium]|nr:cob(I)yrinic acid a,c-diamide adenosyltransferase [Paludibacteraceae bacterium]